MTRDINSFDKRRSWPNNLSAITFEMIGGGRVSPNITKDYNVDRIIAKHMS